MNQTLKIVILAAGWATRMRPQTWSKPKALVSVAGRTVLDHLLEMFSSVPGFPRANGMPADPGQGPCSIEAVIIHGPGPGEAQIPPFMREHHPEIKTHFVLQTEMRGQADAVWLARNYLSGPVLLCFSDTLVETDFSFLGNEKADGVAWVKPVPDPRRFGVAELDGEGQVQHLVEKPQNMENNLVVIGLYFFQQAETLLSAIEEQFRRETALKGEFFLTDAINIMIERGMKLRTQTVEVWLDTGTIDATLATNRYLLEHGKANQNRIKKQPGVTIVPPVNIHPSAEISNSVIGPHVSIGADCILKGARVEDSILESGVTVETAALQGSFIGRKSRVQGRSATDPPMKLNIGDDSAITIKQGE